MVFYVQQCVSVPYFGELSERENTRRQAAVFILSRPPPSSARTASQRIVHSIPLHSWVLWPIKKIYMETLEERTGKTA